jgi:hypothetical protein
MRLPEMEMCERDMGNSALCPQERGNFQPFFSLCEKLVSWPRTLPYYIWFRLSFERDLPVRTYMYVGDMGRGRIGLFRHKPERVMKAEIPK